MANKKLNPIKNFDVNNIQLNIQSPGVELDGSLEEYVISQIEKLGKIFPRIKKCEIILREEKNDKKKIFVFEAKLFVPTNILFSKEQEHDVRLAAKKVFEDLNEQLFKVKEKFQRKKIKAAVL